jgi:hypothetical protein
MATTFQRETLARARDALGKETALSGRLGVPLEELRAMLEGREPVPAWVFLKTVDLINDHEAQEAPPTSDPPPEA